MTPVQKAIRSALAATSFVHNVSGTVLENLRVVEKIVDYLDEYSDVLNIYVAEQEYARGEENEVDKSQRDLTSNSANEKKIVKEQENPEEIKEKFEKEKRQKLEELKNSILEYFDFVI